MQITYGQNDWLAIGDGEWTWSNGLIRQGAMSSSGLIHELFFHTGSSELQRTVCARLHITAVGGESDGCDGGPGITILSMGLAGIGLIVNGTRGVMFQEDLFWNSSEDSIDMFPNVGDYVWLKAFYDPATNTCYGKAWFDGDAEPSQWQITYQPEFHGNAGDSSAEDFVYVGVVGQTYEPDTTMADIDNFSTVLASDVPAFKPYFRPRNYLIGGGIGG